MVHAHVYLEVVVLRNTKDCYNVSTCQFTHILLVNVSSCRPFRNFISKKTFPSYDFHLEVQGILASLLLPLFMINKQSPTPKTHPLQLQYISHDYSTLPTGAVCDEMDDHLSGLDPTTIEEAMKALTCTQAASMVEENLSFTRSGTFAFLSLPGELRNRIYELLLVDTRGPDDFCDTVILVN
ncbi:uncharacterized protein K460DRAFT_370446, partial [Cucurbitaria berberidis CBS 394.84]